MIERTFQDIPDGKVSEADQQSFLASLGWTHGSTWDDLLRSKRVVIVSEAGAGKTYECRAQKKRLFDADQPAFFVELAELANFRLRDLLDPDEEERRFDTWLASRSEVATFFLDSIDELKLTQGSFERSLKRFKRCIGIQLHRVKIVITTRPIPFDEKLIREILQVPLPSPTGTNEETFAEIAMGKHRRQRYNISEDQPSEWRLVGLMPLSNDQITKFALDQGVRNPDQFMEDLQRNNAKEFARRPLDLIGMCKDWIMNKPIRSYREQVETNVRGKLLHSSGRREPAELSIDKAIEGASRLALALQVTRRLTIHPSAASDGGGEDVALDPAKILSDWQPNEQSALLMRPLFDHRSYGRLRFHHRSVAEYLAAERLGDLREKGMTFRALKRILFAETRGKTIALPSKRPVAGWLALKEGGIFELLRDNEPAVLLNEGDPGLLTPPQRNQALRAYVDRYGSSGRSGIRVPGIQIHRFASEDLADEIVSIWSNGVENPDVRKVLIRLIEAGHIQSCAGIVFNVTQDADAGADERLFAIDALIALDDKRLGGIAASISEDTDLWPDEVAHRSILPLFPKYMSVEQLCRILRQIKPEILSLGAVCRELPHLISAPGFDVSIIEELRDGLLEIISEGLKWLDDVSHIYSDYLPLRGILAATCERGLDVSKDNQWLRACVIASGLHYIASRLPYKDFCDDKAYRSLHERMNNLNMEDNRNLFWAADRLLQSLHELNDPKKRIRRITMRNESVQLRSGRDLTWVCEALGDSTRDQCERAMLLEAAMRLPSDPEKWKEHVENLRPLILDEPLLTQRLDGRLKPPEDDKEARRWEKEEEQREVKEKQKDALARDSWIQFYREIAHQPEQVFSSEQSFNAAWDLWNVMHNLGDDKRSDWNRRFIEKQFDSKTADRLRLVLMKFWRNDRPTFPRERPEGERNKLLVSWRVGLTGIYAEAEDRDWAVNLSLADAELAVRYAPIELNGIPQWMESLGVAHADTVRRTLGNELSWELNQPAGNHGYSWLLQGIYYAPARFSELFLPQLNSWLNLNGVQINDSDNETDRLRRVIQVILKHPDAMEFKRLKVLAFERLNQQLPLTLRLIWLSALMQVDPKAGVEELEDQVEKVEPSERSEAVTLLAGLFRDLDNAINLGDERFTPQLLLRLAHLACRHVRRQEDARHDDCYTPDIRDDAETARNTIETAILSTKGRDGLTAKLELAQLQTDFKDRILAIAEESWAQEIDAAAVFDDAQAVELDRSWQAPVLTNDAMFAILKDRLSDLDDLLFTDGSPREAWAEMECEKFIRREILRELDHRRKLIYKVDQEAETADEKKTDIRLRSTASRYEAVIELKLGEKYSARVLLDTIENQLVRKYMAAENCRAGALVVTLAKDREWEHPDEARKIDVVELISLLSKEAKRIEEASTGKLAIAVHFLDLRPQ